MLNLRKDFPIFSTNKANKADNQLIYFDSAATSQKPYAVINALNNFYSYENSPVHRGLYSLAERATILYENSRKIIADFINCDLEEIIFTKSCTESINFVCDSWARNYLKSGDVILVSELEHHSNLLAWIRLSNQLGLILKYIPIKSNGLLDYEKYLDLLDPKVKLVSCTATSNVLGTHVDIEFIIKHAHNTGAKVLIDAAQAVGHRKIDIKKINPDFFVFSGHKIMGPFGIGILYISKNIQDIIEPYQVGGGMVFEIDYHKASWVKPPNKFEAGTPPIAEAIALGTAIEYINNNINFHELSTYEAKLCSLLIEELKKIPEITILGPVEQLVENGHMVSFVHNSIHAHDIAGYLDNYNIAVRAGNHCARNLHKKFNIDNSVRVSFFLYNTLQEVEKFIFYLKKISNIPSLILSKS